MSRELLISALVGMVVGTLCSAVILMIVSKLNLGLEVHGFKGAIIAAFAMGVINTLFTILFGKLR